MRWRASHGAHDEAWLETVSTFSWHSPFYAAMLTVCRRGGWVCAGCARSRQSHPATEKGMKRACEQEAPAALPTLSRFTHARDCCLHHLSHLRPSLMPSPSLMASQAKPSNAVCTLTENTVSCSSMRTKAEALTLAKLAVLSTVQPGRLDSRRMPAMTCAQRRKGVAAHILSAGAFR